MKRIVLAIIVSFCFTLALPLRTAGAWLRFGYEDAVVVERSELIVVAYMKKEPITRVQHAKKGNEGGSWEYHAVLVITEFIKGKLDEKEIPVTIHYGLKPIVGGYRDNLFGPPLDKPDDIIEIIDFGNSIHMPHCPVVKDASKENIWFLRKLSGTYGEKPGTGNFGIVDPEDVQAVALKDYVRCYMTKDPEKAVKDYVTKHPNVARRAASYLDHLEIERILKIKDTPERARRLAPYFVKRHWWRGNREAIDGLIACGEVGAKAIQGLFDDPDYYELRDDIIFVWGKTQYKGCVERLVKLLEEHDKFWAGQALKKGWWNKDVSTELTEKRRDIYCEVYDAVIALKEIGDDRATEAIILTKKRWVANQYSISNTQIVDECEETLEVFSGKADEEEEE